MKRCSSCKSYKSLSEFYKNKSRKDNLDFYCKKCRSSKELEKRRTINGVIYEIYSSQISSSKQRNHKIPSYTFNELKEWCLCQTIFTVLFNHWIDNGYKTKLKPSIDRLDDCKPYTLSNIRIVTWYQNMKKAHFDMKSGKIRNRHQKIFGIHKNTKSFIYFDSLLEAGKELNTTPQNICNCLKGKTMSAKQYVWFYED